MMRFFVKNNDFVMLAFGDVDGAFNILNILSGSLLYLDIKNGDYVVNTNSVKKKVRPQRDTLNELKDQVALLATILINIKYIELRKFKELKKLPLKKKSNCDKEDNYIQKRLRKI